jgi:iron(III) transport system ATP-binding protein
MTIQLSSVTKSFGSHKALNQVDLDIDDGEFFVVLGPSGCGKSTLLRAIAGLEPIDSGKIALGGETVARDGFHLEPERRQTGVVFQSYALWPHMSVAANVAFPMETAGLKKPEIKTRTRDHLATVELTQFHDRKPADLSGGQRQRVALARCLAQGAKTVLMDEPLANLDPHLRSAMEEELAAFHKASGATTLFITHDQREAMALADKVALMWDGKVLQADTPEMLYDRPVNEQVAGFIGRSTILTADVLAVRGKRALVSLAGQAVEVDCAEGQKMGPARLLVRPEHVVVAEDGMPCTVQRVTYRGGYWEGHVEVEGDETPVLINLTRKALVEDTFRLKLRSAWVLSS